MLACRRCRTGHSLWTPMSPTMAWSLLAGVTLPHLLQHSHGLPYFHLRVAVAVERPRQRRLMLASGAPQPTQRTAAEMETVLSPTRPTPMLTIARTPSITTAAR